ncbi:hypothetical protein F4778DRAFT_6609 [Xylariomycetidae sp. FL2044]|nr:hypothetical protein F4778DRAFT_6609 [Xylariomycetidae sp. FL2044]
MLFRPSSILGALSLLSLIQGGLGQICETTDGSPDAKDCEEALTKIRMKELSMLKSNKKPCFGLNPDNSGCETVVTAGSCKVDVCVGTRADTMHPPRIPTADTHGAARNILWGCEKDGRVGGHIFFEKLNENNDPCDKTDYTGDAKIQFSKS